MVKNGTTDIDESNWNIVIDATENYESRISEISTNDAKDLFNHFNDYIKAAYQINATLRKLHLRLNLAIAFLTFLFSTCPSKSTKK